MRVELFAFQRAALADLRAKTAEALGSFHRTHTPQVISFTAPTGAGKTVIMKSLIESILRGDDKYPEQNNAVFVWLSDSPQLNKQSRDKIGLNSNKINYSDCIMIEEDSFDMELFEDGKIYFLNTQKLGKKSKLVRQGDDRTYTIWQTLANTVDKKHDRLYFIIDEAHRGMQGTDAGKATTIMQKFIKGSTDDGLPPMPVVIGISATSERFNKLVEGTSSTIQKSVISAADVRDSGLLKERILLTYPDADVINRDMSILQAAAADWRDKWDRWFQYCQEQHYQHVYPILIVQVLNGSGGNISDTDLSDCLRKIQEYSGFEFKPGQVVHTFGQMTSSLMLNGLEVRYEEPSSIADNRNIRVVFFKENLSTGWDCPRAETMMSFRHATDATYIAQLLGRMVRTPMHMHILVDDVLNDVHLYLPHFSAETVNAVVEALQSAEEGQIPTFIDTEQLGSGKYDTLTVRPKKKTAEQTQQTVQETQSAAAHAAESVTTVEPVVNPPQQTAQSSSVSETELSCGNTVPVVSGTPKQFSLFDSNMTSETVYPAAADVRPVENDTEHTAAEQSNVQEAEQKNVEETFDREAVMRFINDSGLLTYDVRTKRVNDYLVSLFKMTHLLTQSGLYKTAVNDVNGEIVSMIREYIEALKAQGKYDDVMNQVRQFKLSTQIFDVFGEPAALSNVQVSMFSAADVDIDREFRVTDRTLAREGLGEAYGRAYADEDSSNIYKMEFIAFATNTECMNKLHRYAEKKFHELRDKYRRQINRSDENTRSKYDSIASDGDEVSEHSFRLPETITVSREPGGIEYRNHLFVDENTGTAKMKLNSWEAGLIAEEEKRDDFVCWIRNQVRKGLCIPYIMNNETKSTYPDFIIVRRDPATGYVIDILEPHDPSRKDNLNKARGFAKYAQNNREIGRIQLIRMGKDDAGNDRFKRLDMSKEAIRDRVLRAVTNDDLDEYFDKYGFID